MRKPFFRLLLTGVLFYSAAVQAASGSGGGSQAMGASTVAEHVELLEVSDWEIETAVSDRQASSKVPAEADLSLELVTERTLEIPSEKPGAVAPTPVSTSRIQGNSFSVTRAVPADEPEVVTDWVVESVVELADELAEREIKAPAASSTNSVAGLTAIEDPAEPDTPPETLPVPEAELEIVSDWEVQTVEPAPNASSAAPLLASTVDAAPELKEAAVDQPVPATTSLPSPARPSVPVDPLHEPPVMSYEPRPVLMVGPIIMLPEDPEARSSLLRSRRQSLDEVLGWVAEVVDRTAPEIESKPLIQGEIYNIELDGERLDGVLGVLNAQGTMMLPLDLLAAHMGDVFHLDREARSVRYRRKADGTRFVLNLQTGEVTANGSSVGFLPEVKQIDPSNSYYPANAVQVFAGLLMEQDDATRQVKLTHDARLQMVTGFEVYLNGQLLPYLNPEPRAVGHVLLLPLRPIVDELGSRLRVEDGGNQVTVIRRQDNAKISLNLTTGLVMLDGVPQGTAPEIGYADPQQLLIPREALASLTGTYVTLSQGSRRIDIDLDDTLSRIIGPGDSLHDRVKDAPPVLESVELFTDTEHRASAIVKGYYSRYDMQLEYETPSTQGGDGFRADWVQLRTETISGTGLALGDQNVSRRELQGVASGRVRGAYFYDPIKSGLLVATLGQAHKDNQELDNGESVASFGGTVGGVRYYDNDGRFEAGLAVREDEGYRALVASFHDAYIQPDFRLGDLNQRLEVAAGLYDQGDGQNPGGQIHWDARLNPHQRVTLSAMADYTSEEVIRGLDPDTLSDEFDGNLADSAAYGLQSSLRLNDAASVSLGHNRRLRGVLAGETGEDTPAWLETNSVGFSLRTGTQWYTPWTYFGVNRTTADGQSTSLTRQAQASWRLQAWSLLLRHDDRRVENNSHDWQTSAELSREPWVKKLKREARMSFAPRVNIWKPADRIRAEAGALLSLTSGKWLGERTTGALAYARNLGISSVLDEDEANGNSGTQVSGSDYLSATLTYRFNRLFRFDSRYFTDLGDYDDFYAGVTAFYEFNPPRRYRLSQDDAGLLTGSVFLDSNADGVRQDDEKGLAGARVVIGGTRVGLNADREGRFTIQNMPEGVYRVYADTTRLPLGYVAESSTVPPVRIDESMITDLQIPVMLGSQLSGTVYIDENDNGVLDGEDERLENIGLELDSGDESASTLFGQFTFDYLKPGAYQLQVQSDTLPEGIEAAEKKQAITLAPGLGNEIGVRLRRVKSAPSP